MPETIMPPFESGCPTLTEGHDACLEDALARLQRFMTWRDGLGARSFSDGLAHDRVEENLVAFIAAHAAVGARGCLVKYNALRMIERRRCTKDFARFSGVVEPLDFSLRFTLGQLAAGEPR